MRPTSPKTSRQLFLRSALICALVGSAFFALSLKRIEPLPLSTAPLRFEAQSAHAYMSRLAKGFPNRTTWSDSRRQAALWLKSEFRELGYEPQGQHFSEVIDGKEYTDLENVFAEKRGTRRPNEIVLVAAHYDIAENTIEGAMDDAAGVAVVLELARAFAREETGRTIIFLATDSEEFGSFWGARAFAREFARRDQIVAVANFDFPAPERQTKILTLGDGLKTGFAPLWLREIAINSVRSLGTVEALDLQHIVEHVQRAIQIPAADHGAFLAEGIPAFNYAGETDDLSHQMGHYHHTARDVAENIEVQTFDDFGKAAERAIRTIDELPALPSNYRSGSYWKISDHYYLEGWATLILHILAFIPFLTYCWSKFGLAFRLASREQLSEVLRGEAKHFAILLSSLLLGYGVLLLLPKLRIITRYEIFPATQKSLLLYHPDFSAILLVLGAGIAVYWVLARVFRAPPSQFQDAQALAFGQPVDPVEIRHALHAAFLALIIFLAFLKNSYLATLLLLPPAYSWTALRVRRRKEDRLINLLLLSGGLTTFVAIVAILNQIFHIGVPYWYLFLGSAYGLFSAYAVILALMTIAILVRLVRAFVI